MPYVCCVASRLVFRVLCRPAPADASTASFPTSAHYTAVGSAQRIPGPNNSVIGVVRLVGDLQSHTVPATGRTTTTRLVHLEGPQLEGVPFGGMVIQMWGSEAEAFLPRLADRIVALSAVLMTDGGNNSCTFATEIIVEPTSATATSLREWWGAVEVL